MFTNRLFYLLIAFLVVSACAPQQPAPTVAPTEIPTEAPAPVSVETSPVEPTTAASATNQPTITQPTVTATTIAELKGNFEANGHSLYIKCLGTGSPTIVLETGEGGTVSEMFDLQKRLAKRTTTCTYDRANNGLSGHDVPKPRTANDVVEDLHNLLETADIPGPYLLVGHSAGGMFVQLYARTYPDQVIGVVAMNPVPPAHPWLDKVGDASEENYYRGQNGESLDYLTSSDQIATAPLPPDVPFEVLLSTNLQCEGDQLCLKSYSTYEQIMQAVSASWPKGNFSQVEAGHNIFSDNPDAVVAVVERVLVESNHQ